MILIFLEAENERRKSIFSLERDENFYNEIMSQHCVAWIKEEENNIENEKRKFLF